MTRDIIPLNQKYGSAVEMSAVFATIAAKAFLPHAISHGRLPICPDDTPISRFITKIVPGLGGSVIEVSAMFLGSIFTHSVEGVAIGYLGARFLSLIMEKKYSGL